MDVTLTSCSGQQYELLDWLANVTFPTEAKFSNIELAEKTYQSVVRRTLASGVSNIETTPLTVPDSMQTTTCCYYGTLHLEATKKLADSAHAQG